MNTPSAPNFAIIAMQIDSYKLLRGKPFHPLFFLLRRSHASTPGPTNIPVGENARWSAEVPAGKLRIAQSHFRAVSPSVFLLARLALRPTIFNGINKIHGKKQKEAHQSPISFVSIHSCTGRVGSLSSLRRAPKARRSPSYLREISLTISPFPTVDPERCVNIAKLSRGSF